MQIAGTYRFYDIRAARSEAVPAQVNRFLASAQLSDTASRLRGLSESVAKALDVLELRHARGRVASVGSAAPLALSTVATSTTLRSTEEINTISTSYSPLAPAWSGASSADAIMSGIYAGPADDTLTFTVTATGLLGLFPTRISVTNAADETIATLSVPGDPSSHDLGNGLTVSFGAGSFVNGDTFTVDVSATTPTALDPDAAFSGTGNDSPGLEAGFSVQDGSFTINGESISVQTSDTLTEVLARINVSAAGVTAVYDATADQVVFTAGDAGSGGVIELADDSSGLLAALKLAGAEATPGTDDEYTSRIADVDAFVGVVSGLIAINGTSIAIDVNSDTLQDVLDRISDETSAQALWDRYSRRVFIRADLGGQPLDLADDTTGLLAALGVQAGRYEGAVGAKALSEEASRTVADTLSAIAEQFSELDEAGAGDYRSTVMSSLRSKYKQIVVGVADRGYDAMLAQLALTSGNEAGTFGLEGVSNSLERMRILRSASRDAVDLLRGEERLADDGYLERLHNLLNETVAGLDDEAQRLVAG
jgi:hypothetical protein